MTVDTLWANVWRFLSNELFKESGMNRHAIWHKYNDAWYNYHHHTIRQFNFLAQGTIVLAQKDLISPRFYCSDLYRSEVTIYNLKNLSSLWIGFLDNFIEYSFWIVKISLWITGWNNSALLLNGSEYFNQSTQHVESNKMLYVSSKTD